MVDNSSTIDHKQATGINHIDIRKSRVPTTKAIAGYTKENDPESKMEATKLVGHPKAAAGTSITVTKQGKAHSAEQTQHRHEFKKNKGKEKTSKWTGEMMNAWSESINPNGTITEPYGKNEINSLDAGLSHLIQQGKELKQAHTERHQIQTLSNWFRNALNVPENEATTFAKTAIKDFHLTTTAEVEFQFLPRETQNIIDASAMTVGTNEPWIKILPRRRHQSRPRRSSPTSSPKLPNKKGLQQNGADMTTQSTRKIQRVKPKELTTITAIPSSTLPRHSSKLSKRSSKYPKLTANQSPMRMNKGNFPPHKTHPREKIKTNSTEKEVVPIEHNQTTPHNTITLGNNGDKNPSTPKVEHRLDDNKDIDAIIANLTSHRHNDLPINPATLAAEASPPDHTGRTPKDSNDHTRVFAKGNDTHITNRHSSNSHDEHHPDTIVLQKLHPARNEFQKLLKRGNQLPTLDEFGLTPVTQSSNDSFDSSINDANPNTTTARHCLLNQIPSQISRTTKESKRKFNPRTRKQVQWKKRRTASNIARHNSDDYERNDTTKSISLTIIHRKQRNKNRDEHPKETRVALTTVSDASSHSSIAHHTHEEPSLTTLRSIRRHLQKDCRSLSLRIPFIAGKPSWITNVADIPKSMRPSTHSNTTIQTMSSISRAPIQFMTRVFHSTATKKVPFPSKPSESPQTTPHIVAPHQDAENLNLRPDIPYVANLADYNAILISGDRSRSIFTQDNSEDHQPETPNQGTTTNRKKVRNNENVAFPYDPTTMTPSTQPERSTKENPQIVNLGNNCGLHNTTTLEWDHQNAMKSLGPPPFPILTTDPSQQYLTGPPSWAVPPSPPASRLPGISTPSIPTLSADISRSFRRNATRHRSFREEQP